MSPVDIQPIHPFAFPSAELFREDMIFSENYTSLTEYSQGCEKNEVPAIFCTQGKLRQCTSERIAFRKELDTISFHKAK